MPDDRRITMKRTGLRNTPGGLILALIGGICLVFFVSRPNAHWFATKPGFESPEVLLHSRLIRPDCKIRSLREIEVSAFSKRWEWVLECSCTWPEYQDWLKSSLADDFRADKSHGDIRFIKAATGDIYEVAAKKLSSHPTQIEIDLTGTAN